MPKRIQRRRVRGWRLPENAVCVTRPGVFGNPFKVGQFGTAKECVAAFRQWLTNGRWPCSPSLHQQRMRVLARLPELRGKDLACYCPADAEHCHADVLLELAANLPAPEAGRAEG